MTDRGFREWLDGEIERERQAAWARERAAARDVDEAVHRRVRALDRLSALINYRWELVKAREP